MSVSVDITDGIAVLTMDDGKANAISNEMLDSLLPALDEAEEKARSVVLAGRGGVFCAGFHLKTMVEGSSADSEKLAHRGGELALKLFGYKKPIVAACTGHAVAVGGIMLLACDTRIGEPGKFRIGLNESAIGLVFPKFASVIAQHRVPPHRVMPAVIQAKLMDPLEAVDASFLDCVVSGEGQAVPQAIEEAHALAKLPTGAYHDNKMATRAQAISSIKQSLETVKPMIRYAV